MNPAHLRRENDVGPGDRQETRDAGRPEGAASAESWTAKRHG